MKNIIIAGAGPIGLAFAIKLQKIINQHELSNIVSLTVVDRRAGNYDRPGIVARNSLEEFRKFLNHDVDVPDADTTSHNAMYISKLEEALYNIARGLEVNFEQFHFQGFASSGKRLIELKNKQGQTKTLKCDLLLDCTGEVRAVVKALNSIQSNVTPLPIKCIANNPYKKHLIAYVILDPSNEVKCVTNDKRRSEEMASEYIPQFDYLRTQFGWDTFKEPNIESGKWRKKKSNDPARFYFYLEMPKEEMLDIEDQKAWLTAVLKLRTFHNIDFKIDETHPLNFTVFMVNPMIIEKTAYVGNQSIPTIIPCGDAQASPDYRLGTGILNGIKRLTALFNCVESSREDPLYFNLEKYEHEVRPFLAQHALDIKKHYESIESHCDQSNEEILPLYTNKIVLQKHGLSAALPKLYKAIGGQNFKKGNYHEAEKCYRKAIDILVIFNRISNSMDPEMAVIYSNLILVLLKYKKYTDGIEAAYQVLIQIPKNEIKDDIYLKILFNQLRCHIEKGLLENDFNTLSEYRKEIDHLYQQLQDKLSKAEKKTLDEKIAKLEEHISSLHSLYYKS